jgi:glutathione S-transferase
MRGYLKGKSMILWGRNNSSNVQKVAWMLNELGVAYQRKEAGGAFGVVNTPEYKAFNPNSRVPTLQEGDFYLYESNAILVYLGQKYNKFIPNEPQQTAKMHQWLDWQQTTLLPPLTPVFWGLVRTPPEKRDMALIEENAVKTIEVIKVLDAQLAKTEYVLGSEMTLPDFAIAPMAFRTLTLIPNRDPLPNVERWFNMINQRPHFIAHVSGLGLT